ncbi:cobyric acid synthase [Microlunatus spumicola]|uniref:Cobyric acid synthase n=1 Tax=Microlunatus spumicola TaxID=81499 RepID=A0ABP6XEF3_9ACTN
MSRAAALRTPSGASGLLVAGTSSDAGKSLVVTGLCRALVRRGIDVAPYKAQNMSNNSGVCADGSEIGRAQILQAAAARLEPTSAMNPVLLKPGTDRRAHVVVRGRASGVLEAGQYATGRRHLAEAAWAAYAELEASHDLIVCEGAGSPAEINLRSGDYVNLGLARRFGLPVVVVGDIDRGGVLASLYGTVALLEPEDRALVRTFLINKFRGDPDVLAPGLTEITRRTGVPFAGVLPWLDGVWLDAEDSLEVGAWRRSVRGAETGRLRVAVVRLPRVSNATDVEALAAEPGVEVLVTTDPEVVAGADLAVLPGTRATFSDLAWLRRTGVADAVLDRARRGAPLLGICGGYQMLGLRVEDPDGVEADAPEVEGLGLLPVVTGFDAEKTLGRPVGAWQGHEVRAYEIHHGRADRVGSVEAEATPFLDGWRSGSTWGTVWHGTFENDGFRRAWLAEVAAASGSSWTPRPDAPAYGARREAMVDALADAVEEHLDVDLLLAGTRVGAPSRAVS